MSYWLLAGGSIHGTDIRPRVEPYVYDRVFPDERLKGGDIVYLCWGGTYLYGWGFVVSKMLYQDEEMEMERQKVKVAWQPSIRHELVPSQKIRDAKELESLFPISDRNLILLTPAQVNAFNRLLRSQGVEAPEDIQITESVEATHASSKPNQKKLLLAEPQFDTARLMQMLLEEKGYKVFLAYDGYQAVSKAREIKPDLIILEMIMPGLNGLKACKNIKSDEVTRDIPLIFLSVEDRSEVIEQAYDAGANRYFNKPTNPSQLLEYISATLGVEQVTDKDTPTKTKLITEQTNKTIDPYRINGSVLNNKYRLIEYAGSGGMGVVYRALRLKENDIVAVKILKPDIVARSPEYSELFELEAKNARSLDHPHIVRVFDSDKEDGLTYMVMEWIQGRSVEEVITQGQLKISRVLCIFEQVCNAVAYAHQKGIIHLDLKPANIMLVEHNESDDLVKVIDFGLSRVISRESGTTVTKFRGTHQYCAPEQFGGRVSHRSDIYTLGATLYYVITGVIPFGTSYINAKIHPQLELPEIPSVTRQRDMPADVDIVIKKALNKNPDSRQQSALELLEEFRASLKGQLVKPEQHRQMSDDEKCPQCGKQGEIVGYEGSDGDEACWFECQKCGYTELLQ
jgi:CheY-like chemotaxis protein